MEIVVIGAVLVLLIGLGIVLVRVRARARPEAPEQIGAGDARSVATAPAAAADRRAPAGLGSKIRQLLGSAPTDEGWRRLEEALVLADVGPRAAAALVADVKGRFDSEADPAALVHDAIVDLLGPAARLELSDGALSIILVVGVNGAGKSTTIGKLAARLTREGKTVTLANSDTFRAAAGEQLAIWGERAGVQVIAQQRGADPGSVAFDAVTSASARGIDVLIIDTAGRLHTKTPLMEELAKVRRVTEKAAAQAGGAICETLLVLDAQTGQNGIAQARAFTEAVDVTGVVLTKMDGSARGGIVLVVREELGVPVKLVGTGETIDDLEPFDPDRFADRLLERAG
jgi:fused signal recognition particle receptor